MNQLYRHRWVKQEGEIKDARGDYTNGFLLWCRKTEHLTDEMWSRGFARVEFNVSEAAAKDEKSWPPTYGEFLGFCSVVANDVQAHKYFRRIGIEDKTGKEKRKAIGREKSAALKASLFGD